MYWTRADSVWGFAPWLLMSMIWWCGGVLITTYLFRLPFRERLATGLGTGALLFISLSNLVSYMAPFPLALWAGASLVFLLGLYAAWRSQANQLTVKNYRSGLIQLLILAGLTYFFGLINRGLAIFDDYHNLPLISTMAAGDVPPHFYLNTDHLFAYHYGWHLFAASLVRIGDLFPWSAFDISKALSLSLLAILAYFWFYRWTRSRLGATLGAALAVLGGGTRWLLLFVPPERLARASATILLQGSSAYSGPDLATNLSRPWLIEGAGPLPFPFAFANGIFPPAIMALGGSGAIPLATIFLLLLLARKEWSWGSAAVFSLLLATLGLTAEYLFAPLAVGLGLALLLGFWGVKRRIISGYSHLWGWLGIFIASVILAFSSGGLLTEMLRRAIGRLSGGQAVEGAGFLGFQLRWPPALVSGHLGELSLSNPGHILVGLAEIGPLLLLAPWASWWAWQKWKRGEWLLAGTGIATLVGFLVPMGVQYVGRDRDIAHMTGAALFLWLGLAFPLGWHAARHGRSWLRLALASIYLVALFGGLVLLSFQMLAIPRPQLTTFVNDERDASLCSLYWNKLEPGAQILDPIPHRAITLFGAGGGRAYLDFFMPLKEWQALFMDPNPVTIAQAGYDYMYIDQEWWSTLSRQQRDAFKHPCVQQINVNAGKGVGMRRLLDIHACK